jgi:AraC-like DNA-binding protein
MFSSSSLASPDVREPESDLLTAVLQEAGMQRRMLSQRHVAPGAALRFPCGRSLGVHAVVRGRAYLHAPTLPAPLVLEAGDLALMGRGCLHTVSCSAEPVSAEAPVFGLDSAPSPGAAGPQPDGCSVVSGAYQLWNTPLHPLFAELPAWHVVRRREASPLSPLPLALALVSDEAARTAPGSRTVLSALLDVVFALVLREWLARPGAAEADRPVDAGFCRAMADARLRPVVTAMQADCARGWTLDDLARLAGLSRTAFAQRFREAMGDTPANHLRTLRMQRAARLLADTEHTLEDVAQAVGYQDAFGFSKVFKRTTGESPRAFRQRDAADRASAWRFAAR